MSMMLVAVLALAAGAFAGEHLVSQGDMAGRLREAGEDSVRRVASGRADVPATVARPLSDEELDDLSRRAADLDTDPVASGAGHVAVGFVLGAAVATVVIIYLTVSDPNY